MTLLLQPVQRLAWFLIFALIALLMALPAGAADLCNTTNVGGVQNNPPNRRAPCRLTQTAQITELVTYHWNNGRGSAPGSIRIFEPSTGRQYGPFRAVGTPGQGGARDVNWVANVNVTLPPGDYEILDSDDATWSWNAQSQGNGFAIVRGQYTVASGGGGPPPPAAGTTSANCPSGPNAKGQPIGGLHCPCNYPVGWGSPNVNTTNPGLRNWWPSCKPPLQCLGNTPGANPYGNASCQ